MNNNLRSKDYKRMALDALRGNWKTAMLTGFVASLFGATVIQGSSINFNFTREYPIEDMASLFGNAFGVFVQIFAMFAMILSIVSIIISGAMRMGYANYNLNLIDNKTAVFRNLFSHMNRKWSGFCMNFFMSLYIALWSLLLFIPGVVKSVAYAMTPYILAENPDMTANEAITESQSIMDGHKWDLFCLHLSFFGWGLLAALPVLLVIIPAAYAAQTSPDRYFIAMVAAIPLSAGFLFVQPYMEAANAAFYRNLTPKQEESVADWYLSE